MESLLFILIVCSLINGVLYIFLCHLDLKIGIQQDKLIELAERHSVIASNLLEYHARIEAVYVDIRQNLHEAAEAAELFESAS